MRVFIAGATGVLGRRAVPRLVADGHTVTAVSRTVEKRDALERAGARPIALDLFDAEAVRRAVAGHDAVLNLATSIPPLPRLLFPWAWHENDRLRRQASTNLAEGALAAGASRFVQESFAPVYPDRGEEWIAEDTPLEPERYTRSVCDAEHAAERFAEGGGEGTVLRFAYFYGADSALTRSMFGLARRGWLAVPGPPDGFFSAVSHDDAAAALVAALDAPGGVYNVVDDEPLRRRELADAMAEVLGLTHAPKLPPPGLARVAGGVARLMARSLRISNRKLVSASRWLPRHPSVREGFGAVLEELEREHAAGEPAPAR